MAFLGIGAKTAKPRAHRNRQKVPKWLKGQERNAASLAVVEDAKTSSPMMKAALIKHITGLDIEASSIKEVSPKERLKAAVTDLALKDLTSDTEFLQAAKEAIIDDLYSEPGKRRPRFNPNEQMPYGFDPSMMNGGQQPPMGPLDILDQAEQIKERVGGGGGLNGIMNSQVLSDMVKTLGPALMAKMMGGSATAAPPARTIAVDVDGRFVEFTPETYEVYKRQCEAMKRLGPASPAPASPAPGETITERTKVTATMATEQKTVTEAVLDAPAAKPLDPTQKTIILSIAKPICTAMDTLSPFEFVDQLKEDARTDEASGIMLNLLPTLDYDTILAKAQEYKADPDLGPLVTKLEKNENWVRDVLFALQDKPQQAV